MSKFSLREGVVKTLFCVALVIVAKLLEGCSPAAAKGGDSAGVSRESSNQPIDSSRRRRRDPAVCTMAVLGSEPRRRRKADCTCADGEVLHGPVPECWGLATPVLDEDVSSGAIFDSTLVAGKNCRCVSQAAATGDRKTFADYSWSSQATRACRGANSKLVYWLRHAEGYHQVPHRTECMNKRDPGLTETGKSQAKSLMDAPTLAAAFDNAEERPQLVVASPLVRTMETSIIGFGKIQEEATWVIDADIQEVPGTFFGQPLQCNFGDPSAGKELLTKYNRNDLVSQYDDLDPQWNNRKDGRFNDDNKELRFKEFTERLSRRDESRIIVVSHGNVLEEILGASAPQQNAEVKAYSLCGNQWLHLGR